MAQLTFSKVDNHWEATATINEASPLHVERVGSGFFGISMKSYNDNSLKYANVPGGNTYNPIVDADIISEVYPKYLRFISEVEVTKAYIG